MTLKDEVLSILYFHSSLSSISMHFLTFRRPPLPHRNDVSVSTVAIEMAIDSRKDSHDFGKISQNSNCA